MLWHLEVCWHQLLREDKKFFSHCAGPDGICINLTGLKNYKKDSDRAKRRYKSQTAATMEQLVNVLYPPMHQ